MNRRYFPLLLVIMVTSVAVAQTPQISFPPMNPAYQAYLEDPQSFGYEPLPFKIKLSPISSKGASKASYDYTSWCTAIRDQNPCNSCWIFSPIAGMEATIKHFVGGSPDYSESNILMCNGYHNNCSLPGPIVVSLNQMIIEGAMLESCQNWSQRSSCFDCTPQYRISGYQFLGQGYSDSTLKAELSDGDGPIVITMMASELSGLGSHICSSTDATCGAHAVLCVGFDDAGCSGNGHWKIKNSWGIGWGNSGWANIQMGTCDIASDSSSCEGYRITDYEAPLGSSHRLLYNDELGFTAWTGYYSETAYGATRFQINDRSIKLQKIEFCTVDNDCDYEIRIYSTYSGGSFSDQLGSAITGNMAEAGYHQISLPAEIEMNPGDDFYIWCKWTHNTPGSDTPIPVDFYGSASGETYISSNGSAWLNYSYDISLRAIGELGEPLPSMTTIGAILLVLLLSIVIIVSSRRLSFQNNK